jgi:cyclopropane fatty-acyl-phospholipid synthase-like methyltransferase
MNTAPPKHNDLDLSSVTRMKPQNEWEQFFDGHSPIYMTNSWTKHTLEEVDFIIKELKLPKGSNILDVGCGTGRHAVELARRGFKVTGIDISKGMLAEAEKTARRVGVKVELIHVDATRFRSAKLFDAAICLCEGAFGLLGSSDHPLRHDIAILHSINVALRDQAPVIVTLANGSQMIRKYNQAEVESGRFDLVTMTEVSTMEWDTADGKKSVVVRERGYVPTEIFMIFGQAGFRVEHIWGGTAGNWERKKINLDEIEIMVIARKSSETPIAPM